MAEYFVRPDTSHSVTRDGKTYEKAWGGWSEIIWGGSGVKPTDVLYVCGVHTLSNFIAVGNHGATPTDRTVISGGYGPNPGTIAFTTGNFFLQIGRSYTTLEDLPIVANTRNCIYLFSANALTGVTIQRCTLTGGTGGPIISVDASNGQSHVDLTIDDNDFIGGSGASLGGAISWTVAASGLPLSNLNRVTIKNNRFTGCAAARAVIQLRLENLVNGAANMADIIVTDNTFRDCPTLAMEIYGPSEYGRNTGIRVTDNKFYDMTANDEVFNIGGAIGIGGFAPSLTPGFGDNVIARNEGYRLTGPTGLANLFYGSYQVYNNYGEDIVASQADGNGILIDHGCDNVAVYGNRFKRVIGNPATENSGCGLMILDATNITAHSNIVDGCKIGIYVGNKLTGQSCNIYNNTFRDCSYAGVLATSTADLTTFLSRNNLFTAVGSCPSVKCATATWAGESYNCFHSFTAPVNHTLSGTTLTIDPSLDERHGCSTGTVVGKGTPIGSYLDVYGRAFNSTPSIGAVEAVTKDLYRTLRGI